MTDTSQDTGKDPVLEKVLRAAVLASLGSCDSAGGTWAGALLAVPDQEASGLAVLCPEAIEAGPRRPSGDAGTRGTRDMGTGGLGGSGARSATLRPRHLRPPRQDWDGTRGGRGGATLPGPGGDTRHRAGRRGR